MITNQSESIKPWKCEHGHVLGAVERVKITTANGSTAHVSRLMLYRQAVDPEADQPVDVDVIAAVEGTTLNIRCSICGAVRPWFIGEDAIERLLERFQRGKK
jgi:hypothetical protein